jgi:hypothetical protein
MLGTTSADPTPEGSGLSPRLAAAIVALLAASFAGGALLFGLGGTGPKPSPVAADSGCRERPLTYGLGDDPAAQDRRARAERAPVPERGFYGAATAPPPLQLLHAGAHGFVVVRYRLTGGDVAPLRRLIQRKLDGDAAVVAAPGGPAGASAPALTATMWGRELRCRAAGSGELRALERFIDSLGGAG